MRTGFLLTQGSHARRLMLAEGMGIKRAPDAAVLIAVFSARRQYPVSADADKFQWSGDQYPQAT